MAKRNMFETVKEYKHSIPTHYDLNAAELNDLYQLAHDSIFDSFVTAFVYGFALGSRAERNRKGRKHG